MPRLVRKLPSYRLHKASGQAMVLLDGKAFYLGPYGTDVSRREYDRLVGDWLTLGADHHQNRPFSRTATQLLGRPSFLSCDQNSC